MSRMKNRVTLKLVVLGTILLLAPFAVNLSAAERPFKSQFSGWALGTALDTNGDGVTGGHTWSKGKSNLGSFEGGGFVEGLPWDGVSFCSLSPLEIKFEGGLASFVSRYHDGSLLQTELTSSTTCINVEDPDDPINFLRFTVEQTADFVGGSGRFEGSTGSVTCRVIGKVTAGVTSSSGECSGVIEIP